MLPLISCLRKSVPIVLFLVVTLVHAADEKIILVFGDSLSSGYRIDARQSWPALLQKRLQEMDRPVRVVNASRKGETSEGGRKRLPEALAKYQPTWVILALGANDGLRMRSLDGLKTNLGAMIAMVRESGATPILVGMKLPPTFEPRYSADFSNVFAETAKQAGTPFVPFLLKEVVERPELFLSDRLHPNAEAQAKLLDVVWPVVDKSL